MFTNLTFKRIMDIIIGRQCWNPYIESWKSWAQDWTQNSDS
jgi:hypothetical protein